MRHVSVEGMTASAIAARVLETLDTSDMGDVIILDSMTEINDLVRRHGSEERHLNTVIVTTGMERRATSQKLVQSIESWGLLHAAEPEYLSDEKPWEKFRDAPNRRKRK